MSTELLKTLTTEQKIELKAAMEAEEKANKERTKEDRETYKALVNEAVAELFVRLKDVSLLLVEEKANVFKRFEQILDMKHTLYGVKTDQSSHTFTSLDGSVSIKIGNRVIDSYDDTVNIGVTKVREYIKTLAKDDNSAALVDTVMNLLKRDDKGNMKASRVMELKKLAHKTGDETFLDGIRIIEESYKPIKSCQFVSASFKDDLGKEHFLPLSMSSAE